MRNMVLTKVFEMKYRMRIMKQRFGSDLLNFLRFYNT